MKTDRHEFSGLQTIQLWSRATLSQFTLVELLVVIAIIAILMADKTYRLSTQGVMNNHDKGGNFLYGDGHVAWWPYNTCLLGTNNYGPNAVTGSSMLPPYHIWPDRAEGGAPAGISSISTGASGTAVWIGRPSTGSYFQ